MNIHLIRSRTHDILVNNNLHKSYSIAVRDLCDGYEFCLFSKTNPTRYHLTSYRLNKQLCQIDYSTINIIVHTLITAYKKIIKE